ncbi:pyruvate dehydrogenase (acetyl-transferring) E1 component subunit alpha [Marinivivus vitaminiproducens]|uniref:pyruvate dehydrogenase (acetyl-transferring) E1 component subunit alpha n=1 Tax=Marinivivus vitaminiproducens TaxID=3035935 RepID=UPI0027A69AE9|nr:pyruvate dehydrogenase (acetyl-transferring) E1 component subunit alpha [Geminicoccaceae bacterium SCSIO 64248]
MATAKRRTAVRAVDNENNRADALPDKDVLSAYYRDMLLIRRFEEKAGQLYGMGLIGGFCHLYIGQEAVAVGIQHALKPGDSVITGYRDHGHMLVTGMEAKRVMAELTGRVTGYSKGKGGSMHMFARDKGFYGGHGIVGAQVPLGSGIAFAHKYREDGGVAICYLGDGAVNQGQVYEAFNMASLWKLPILYVIENNQYGMGTSVKRASATIELYKRGEAHGIPGDRIDGMDVLKVRDAANQMIEAIRKGEGPHIMEAMTYRYRGHSMSDPAKYRSKQEVEQMRTEQDPIERLRKMVLENELFSENELKDIDKAVRAEVNEAATFAQESPEPDESELWTDILLDAKEEEKV